jgi:radical SAM-linked protein
LPACQVYEILNAMDAQNQPAQRLRLTFSKEGPARYISHLDLARTLERALIRAALPVAYSQGFTRRPRLSIAAALPLGYTSEAEIADVWLNRPVAPDEFQERLTAKMAPGITVRSTVEAPLSGPSLQLLLAESSYLVWFPDPVDLGQLQKNAETVLAAETLIRQRSRARKSRSQSFDLRPLILEMRVTTEEDENPCLFLRLAQTATQTGRPEDVLADLDFDPLDAWVHRSGLRLQEPPPPAG